MAPAAVQSVGALSCRCTRVGACSRWRTSRSWDGAVGDRLAVPVGRCIIVQSCPQVLNHLALPIF